MGFILVNSLPTASASTTGAVYLVPDAQDATVKNMYVTVQTSGGGYTWTQIGSSSFDLTGYATQEWVEGREVDLTQAQYDALVQAGTVDPNKRYYVNEE